MQSCNCQLSVNNLCIGLPGIIPHSQSHTHSRAHTHTHTHREENSTLTQETTICRQQRVIGKLSPPILMPINPRWPSSGPRLPLPRPSPANWPPPAGYQVPVDWPRSLANWLMPPEALLHSERCFQSLTVQPSCLSRVPHSWGPGTRLPTNPKSFL